MRYYINGMSAYDPQADLKELIPDANMRRRMSHVVKMGVGTALECIRRCPNTRIDAIVTATGLGCLADSERFLSSVVENGEQLLNPTPFIQSTFNTIGGHIALLTGNHCYNMTYSHRNASFESALCDALLLLEASQAENVLVGAADETTSTQRRIMERMGAYRDGTVADEGACFFIIGREPAADCKASIELAVLCGEAEAGMHAAPRVSRSYHTASAAAVYEAVRDVESDEKEIAIRNGVFLITVRCL